jgi:hypothetical protein
LSEGLPISISAFVTARARTLFRPGVRGVCHRRDGTCADAGNFGTKPSQEVRVGELLFVGTVGLEVRIERAGGVG